MRVIAGKYRSRPLQAPRGAGGAEFVRPTADKLRGTLFNVLAAAMDLEGTTWLDLYAGSGAVGIEALSRGAREVWLVESARGPAATIRANLKALGIATGWQLLEQPVAKALERLETASVAADVIFLDPPYSDAEAYAATLGSLAPSSLLRPETIVVAEHSKRFDPGAQFGALARYRELKQGDAVLSFYRLS